MTRSAGRGEEKTMRSSRTVFARQSSAGGPFARWATGDASRRGQWGRGRWGRRSLFSLGSFGSMLSILSMRSAGSILSIGSIGSVLSIGSAGSILSIGSAGSILSIGSAGGVLRIGGRGSALEERQPAARPQTSPTAEVASDHAPSVASV